MGPKILVTGGSGLLGSYLLRMFRQLGYDQITATYQQNANSIPADLKEGIEWKPLRLPDVQDSFDIINDKDWVIHSAGLISYNKGDKDKLLAINQEGTRHIVNACLEHEVKHFVYISSIGALGKEKNFVTLNEESPFLENEFSTTYGLSKYLGELEAWRGATEGLNVSTILPSVILGTGDWHRSSLQLIDRVATKAGWYPGGQTGYVDVRDISNFIKLLLEKNITGDRWILNAENISYQKMYTMIGEALELNKKFQPAPKWLAGMVLYSAGILQGKQIGLEILKSAYGTFTYDNAKSLGLEGFTYRKVGETISEIVEIYKSGSQKILG
jgi:dihydroflavonol-4-reductase